MHAVIYTKPNCVQCRMSRSVMKKNNLPFIDNYYGDANKTNSIDINSDDNRKRSWSERKIESLKNKYGIKQLPFIKIIDDDNKIIDSWTGFRPEKLKHWASKINQE